MLSSQDRLGQTPTNVKRILGYLAFYDDYFEITRPSLKNPMAMNSCCDHCCRDLNSHIYARTSLRLRHAADPSRSVLAIKDTSTNTRQKQYKTRYRTAHS